eukprot:4443318-Pyramimonas_sp.AAC.1
MGMLALDVSRDHVPHERVLYLHVASAEPMHLHQRLDVRRDPPSVVPSVGRCLDEVGQVRAMMLHLPADDRPLEPRRHCCRVGRVDGVHLRVC